MCVCVCVYVCRCGTQGIQFHVYILFLRLIFSVHIFVDLVKHDDMACYRNDHYCYYYFRSVPSLSTTYSLTVSMLSVCILSTDEAEQGQQRSPAS